MGDILGGGLLVVILVLVAVALHQIHIHNSVRPAREEKFDEDTVAYIDKILDE